jgi:hypothetical protein
VQCGVEGVVHGRAWNLTFSIENPVCLALPGYSLPAAALFVLSRPSSITRHLAGCFCFVSVVHRHACI